MSRYTVFLPIISVLFSLSVQAESAQVKIINDIKNFYSANNIKIDFEINENSSSVSASADTDGQHHKVVIDRGLLSSMRLSEDGLRVVICHEIGHILSGAPRKSAPMDWDGPLAPDGDSWMSSEGQSDYYANSICFRNIVQKQNHFLYLKNVPASVVQLCNEAWGPSTKNSQICQRAALGGENFLKLTFDFPISFDTPSTEVTDKTIKDSYPSRQCRLDTLLAGALCRESFPLKLDLHDPSKYNCSNKIGQRPSCWYAGR